MAKNIKGRKFVATAATAALVASAIVPVASAATADFSDASKVSSWATEYVNYATTNGLLKGNADGTFNPQGPFTRAQAAQVMVNVLGLNTTNVKSNFADVPADAWYYGVVNAVKDAGLVDGVGGGNFAPDANLTRQDAAKLFGELFDLDPAKADKKVLDAFADKATIADYADEYVAIFVAAGVINGDGVGFNPTNNITREELAKIISLAVQADEAGKFDTYKKVEEVKEVKITSVSAINATTARVTFANALPADADFSNFDINGGLTITNVELSADRKTATITSSASFTRNQEYTISVFGIKNAEGEEFPEAKGSFTWEVAEGVTVDLTSTTLEKNQVIGLTVKDAEGKDVSDATVTVTSFNTNILNPTTASGTPNQIKLQAGAVAGTTDVQVITVLPDGTRLTNTFKVTVKEAVTTVANAGYTLIDATALAAAQKKYANTAAFKKFAVAKTSLVENSGTVQIIAFGETNGNPDQQHLDFTNVTRVVSSNPLVATAVKNGANIDVTPLAPGTTTVTVTMQDGSRKTFPVTVTATPVMKDIKVSETTVNLSDENAGSSTNEEGVDAKTITITSLDQFGKSINFDTNGKITVSSSTNGIVLYDDLAETNNVTNTALVLPAATTTKFVIAATANTPVKNAKVTVNYFAKATDDKPTSTKTITVNVADILTTSAVADIEVVAGNEIDANGANVNAPYEIDFTDTTATQVYALDSKGNRLKIAATPTVAPVVAIPVDPFVTATGAKISFTSPTHAQTYLRAANTINVDVTSEGVTKRKAIKYVNSAVVPNKVTVATAPVSIKLASGVTSIDVEDIIFGQFDPTQLILDDADSTSASTGDDLIGVLKNARNAGYLYNKSLLSVVGTDGKALATGTSLYGTDTSSVTIGKKWYNDLLASVEQVTNFATDSDELIVDYAIANVNDVSTVVGNTITPAGTAATTFTLVVKGVYVKGALANMESVAGDVFANATPAQLAKHNLLAAPVQLNVSVAK